MKKHCQRTDWMLGRLPRDTEAAAWYQGLSYCQPWNAYDTWELQGMDRVQHPDELDVGW